MPNSTPFTTPSLTLDFFTNSTTVNPFMATADPFADPIVATVSPLEPIDLDKISRDIAAQGWEQWLQSALIDAFLEARKGKLSTRDEYDFELNWTANLQRLTAAIDERYYEPGANIASVVFDPVICEISVAPFRDRIVHHFLFNMQYGWWERRFIEDSYSCRKNKSALYGIRRAQRMMQLVTRDHKQKAHVIKLDIDNRAMPRDKVYERVKWGLERQFEAYKSDPHIQRLRRTCEFLWHQILFDDTAQRAQGIGNLTAQLASNIYLDQLDRFIKYELGYKYYGRHIGDFFYMVPANGYQRAKSDVARIEQFLADLGLGLHAKRRYYATVDQGMQFLGARIYPHCLYPSDRTQAHFYRAAEEVATGQRDPDAILSYLGIMQHFNADKFLQQAFDRYGWDYRPSKN